MSCEAQMGLAVLAIATGAEQVGMASAVPDNTAHPGPTARF